MAASLPGGVKSQLGVQALLPPIPSSASVTSQSSLTETAARATEEKSIEEETDSDLLERAADVFNGIFGQEPNKSIFDLQLPAFSIESVEQEYSLQDLSPVLQPAPPPCQKSANWFNDALDSAGYRIEMGLYQAFKVQLLSLADSDPHRESARRGADALLLIAKALQEARTTRLQGRFGFRMAEQMKSENATGL
ncbi:uncharacterized protein MONOS_9863 [Monocercomonoides exilis]|uniref:uncharacterized protein n=1 Tax=Monocercomonoides exilis TaxID=2049356 RepID=UPI00355A0B09|nr:hypothetical protein MONOS_9863 [Monocercomonoides exilis]|eukprot:MONOS_9863.1-p1 / transcript=MONOS_9863.1 / gene=MONOS_9863 / organism=Monocercomonoides_exilis_PA203 / gene_product=unspecified product / transcript_product=unspecified product / location=Mono_scaffold00423:25445-26102(+) / protein_length=194 / sequence_SO=supercontig / SO=protein_coding / is_pseudo=false